MAARFDRERIRGATAAILRLHIAKNTTMLDRLAAGIKATGIYPSFSLFLLHLHQFGVLHVGAIDVMGLGLQLLAWVEHFGPRFTRMCS